MLNLREDAQKIITESQIKRMAELLLSSEDFYDDDVKILKLIINDNGSMNGDFKNLDNNRVFEFAINGQDVSYKPRIKGRRDSTDWSDSRLLLQWEVESKVYLKQFPESRFDARKKRGKIKKKPKCTGISYNCGKRCLGVDLNCRVSERNNRSKQRLENLQELAKKHKAGEVGPFYAGSGKKAEEVEAMRKAAYEQSVKRRESAREKRRGEKAKNSIKSKPSKEEIKQRFLQEMEESRKRREAQEKVNVAREEKLSNWINNAPDLPKASQELKLYQLDKDDNESYKKVNGYKYGDNFGVYSDGKKHFAIHLASGKRMTDGGYQSQKEVENTIKMLEQTGIDFAKKKDVNDLSREEIDLALPAIKYYSKWSEPNYSNAKWVDNLPELKSSSRQKEKSDRLTQKLSPTAQKGKELAKQRKSKDFQEPPSTSPMTKDVERVAEAKANIASIVDKLGDASPKEFDALFKDLESEQKIVTDFENKEKQGKKYISKNLFSGKDDIELQYSKDGFSFNPKNSETKLWETLEKLQGDEWKDDFDNAPNVPLKNGVVKHKASRNGSSPGKIGKKLSIANGNPDRYKNGGGYSIVDTKTGYGIRFESKKMSELKPVLNYLESLDIDFYNPETYKNDGKSLEGEVLTKLGDNLRGGTKREVEGRQRAEQRQKEEEIRKIQSERGQKYAEWEKTLPEPEKTRSRFEIDRGRYKSTEFGTVLDGKLGVHGEVPPGKNRVNKKYHITHLASGKRLGGGYDKEDFAVKSSKTILNLGIDLDKEDFSHEEKRKLQQVANSLYYGVGYSYSYLGTKDKDSWVDDLPAVSKKSDRPTEKLSPTAQKGKELVELKNKESLKEPIENSKRWQTIKEHGDIIQDLSKQLNQRESKISELEKESRKSQTNRETIQRYEEIQKLKDEDPYIFEKMLDNLSMMMGNYSETDSVLAFAQQYDKEEETKKANLDRFNGETRKNAHPRKRAIYDFIKDKPIESQNGTIVRKEYENGMGSEIIEVEKNGKIYDIGIGVSKSYDYDDASYQLTHLQSGMSVAFASSPKEAENLVKMLRESEIDMSKSSDEFTDQEKERIKLLANFYSDMYPEDYSKASWIDDIVGKKIPQNKKSDRPSEKLSPTAQKGKKAVDEYRKKKDLTKGGSYQEPAPSTGAIAKPSSNVRYVADIKALDADDEKDFKPRPFDNPNDPRYTPKLTRKEIKDLKIKLSDTKEGLTGGELARVKINRTLGANGNYSKARFTSNPKLLFGSLDEKEKAIADFQSNLEQAIKEKTGKSFNEASDNRDYWRYVAQVTRDEQIKTFDTDDSNVAKEANPFMVKAAEKLVGNQYNMEEWKGKKELNTRGWSEFNDILKKDRNLPESLKQDLISKAKGGEGIEVQAREIEDRLTNKAKTSDKLEKLAINRINRTEEKLEEIADRKQNTYRRASNADYARERTTKTKTNAETLAKLAKANKDGRLSSGLKNISQLKQLKVIEDIDSIFDDNFTSPYRSMESVFNDTANKQTLNRLGIENTDDLITALKEYRQYKKDAPTISKIERMERELIGNKNVGIDYFPTPPKVANRVVEKADIRPGMTVLEPSAGNGAIADAVRQSTPNARITTNEISSQLVDILKAKGYDNTQKDFLSMPTDQKYDRIVMNPPFGQGTQGSDQLHIRHAYNMLAPNGRLVAVASEGSFSRSDRNARDFQQWVKSVGGEVEKVESGAFKSSINPTGTATRIVTINKGDRRDSENARRGKRLVAAYQRQKMLKQM